MNTYRVTFTYSEPNEENLPSECWDDGEGGFLYDVAATIRAPNSERAPPKALLEKKLPAAFVRGEPIFWHEGLSGENDRWPVVVDQDTLAWGDEDDAGVVTFRVERSDQVSE